MTALTMLVAVGLALVAPAPSEACVIRREPNKLLGWSKDGKLALHARVDDAGKLEFAELHPTRYEGHRYLITSTGTAIRVARAPLATKDDCDATKVEEVSRHAGVFTEASLRALPMIQALELVAPPSDDGGAAAKLAIKFAPARRYAEHKLELFDSGDAAKRIATLAVPIWCSGSCLRDEAFADWSAQVTHVATAGDRTLYVVRIKSACNGGTGKELWIDRVIAAPGQETAPKHGRCRGSLP